MSVLANEAMREEENNINNSQNSQDAAIVDEDIEERKLEVTKAQEMLEKFIAELGEKANETVDFEKYSESFKFKTKLHHMSLEELRANWEKIQIKLMSCKSPQTNWNEEELNALIWLSLKYAELHSKDVDDLEDEDFEFISHFLPLKDGAAVKHKWQSMKSVPAGQIPWSREEEELLSQIYQTFKKQDKQNKWSDISKVLESKTKIFRRGKQCRERWNNYLDPDMNRGNWSDDEDYKLLSIALELGSTQWSSLAKRLSKRTENAVKNRFKSLMKKERKERIKNGIEVKSAEALTEHIDKTILAEILEKLKDKILLKNLQAQQENNNNMPISSNNNNNNPQLQGNPSTNGTSTTAAVVPPIYQVYFAPTGYGPMIPSGQFLAPAVQPINFQILNQNNNSSTPYSSPDHSPQRPAFIQQRMGNTDEAMKQQQQQQQFNNPQQFSFSQQQAQQQQQQPIVGGTTGVAAATATAEQAIQQQLSQLNLNGMSPVNQSIFKQQILQQQLFQQQQQQAQLQQAQIQQLQQQQQQQIQQNGSIASLMQNLQSQAMINHTNLVSSPQFINSAVGQPFLSAINSNRSTGGMAGSFSEAMNIIYSGANTPSNAVSSAMIKPNGGIAAVQQQQANAGTAVQTSPFMPVFPSSNGKPGEYTPQPKSSPMLLQQPHLSSFSGNNTPQSNRNKRTDKTSQFADFEKLQKLRIGELEDHSASPMHITEKTASPSERKAMQLMVKTKIEEEGEDEEIQQQQQQLYPQDNPQQSKSAVNGQLHDSNHINSPLRLQQEPYDSDSGNNEFKRRPPAGTSSFNKFRKDDAIMQQKQQQQMQIIQQQQQSQQQATSTIVQSQQQSSAPLLPLAPSSFQLRPMKMELQQQSIITEQQQQQQCNSPQNQGSLGNLSSQPDLPALPQNQQSQYTSHQLSFQHLDYLAMVQQQQQQLAQQQQQQQQFQQIFSPSNSNNQKQAASSQQSLGFGMFVSPLAMIQQKQTQLSQQQQQQQQQQPQQIIPNNPGIQQVVPPPLNLTACQSNDIMTQHSLLNFYNTRPMQPLLMQQQQQQQQQQQPPIVVATGEKTEQMENPNDLLLIQNMLPSLSLQQIDLLQQQLQQQQKAKLQQQQQMYQQQQMQQQSQPLQNTSTPSNFQQLLVQQQQQAVAAAAAAAAAAAQSSIH